MRYPSHITFKHASASSIGSSPLFFLRKKITHQLFLMMLIFFSASLFTGCELKTSQDTQACEGTGCSTEQGMMFNTSHALSTYELLSDEEGDDPLEEQDQGPRVCEGEEDEEDSEYYSEDEDEEDEEDGEYYEEEEEEEEDGEVYFEDEDDESDHLEHRDPEDRENDQNTPQRLLAMGDSVLDWNRDSGESIPDFVGRFAQLEVANHSISGSQLLDSSSAGIPQQYQSGEWSWVLIDGGANDVGDGCGCGSCMSQVDRIIDTSLLEGVMVDLIDRVVEDGAQIILLGYYTVISKEFAGCEDEAAAINLRYQLLADQNPHVTYVDMGEAVLGEPSSSYLDEDGIHPSPRGGEIIARYIAQSMID